MILSQLLKDRFVIIIQSLVFFLLAYLFIWIFQSLATVITANQLGIPVVWGVHGIDFVIPQSQWDADLVKLTFSSGPLVGLIISLVCLVIYLKAMHYNGILKLFFLWAFIHGWTGFFGGIMVGTLTNTGLGFVADWMYLMDTAMLLVTLLSIFMVFIGGFIIARPALISANYYFNRLPVNNRMGFILSQFVLPWCLGMFCIVLFRSQASLESHLITSAILILLFPLIMLRKHFPDMYFEEEQVTITFELRFLIFLLALMLLIRIGLSQGIRLGF